MATQMIDCGVSFTMTQNQVYAMPPHKVYRLTFNDGNTYQTANDVAFTNPVATPNGTDVARAFIRCTTGNGIIKLATSG